MVGEDDSEEREGLHGGRSGPCRGRRSATRRCDVISTPRSRMRGPGGACRSGVGVVLDGSDIGACWSGATPAHLQHTSNTNRHLVSTPPSSELLERVGSVSTPLQYHTSTPSTRLRVTLGAAHTTSRDPKVKIRSGRPPKTRFQAGFAISTGFRKPTTIGTSATSSRRKGVPRQRTFHPTGIGFRVCETDNVCTVRTDVCAIVKLCVPVL